MNAIIAVPSMSPGGLEAAASPHFGHCDVFTLVEVRDGIVRKTTTLPTPNHGQGGCMVCRDVGCNPDSLGLEFVQAADGAVTASFPVTSRHQGSDGLLHGGMIGTFLDAAMTHCLFAQGIQALTAETTVRFIAPVETGRNVTLTARLLGQKHGIYRLESKNVSGETVIGSCLS